MKTIGFAGTFYTLWDVQSEKVNLAPGASYTKVSCTYYRNLSKDLAEAIEKAGTDNVDETLKGKRRSFEYKTPVKLEPKLITEAERLYRIILVNDRENMVAGVRQDAFNQAIALGYLTEVIGDFSYVSYSTGLLVQVNEALKWNTAPNQVDVWGSSTLGQHFIGTF